MAKLSKYSYEARVRRDELVEDIKIIKQHMLTTKTFEAAVSLKKLMDKLEHEKRVCK